MKVVKAAKELSRDELLDIFEVIHKQYLIRDNLFKRLLRYMTENGMGLPPFEELLKNK